MNLKDHELDQVAKFMGHDIRVHREYYRLTENTLQLAKMSKLLLAIECGTTVYKGKSLDEIDFELEGEYVTLKTKLLAIYTKRKLGMNMLLYKTFLFCVVVTVALSKKPKQGCTEHVMMETSKQEQDGMQVIIVEVRLK